eukprot:gene13362-19207_t
MISSAGAGVSEPTVVAIAEKKAAERVAILEQALVKAIAALDSRIKFIEATTVEDAISKEDVQAVIGQLDVMDQKVDGIEEVMLKKIDALQTKVTSVLQLMLARLKKLEGQAVESSAMSRDFTQCTKRTLRLVCKASRQDVDSSTRCLTWDGRWNVDEGLEGTTFVLSQHALLQKCTALHAVRILSPPNGTASLSGLPPGVDSLELSALSRLSLPEGSCTSLHSLTITDSATLDDLSSLRACPHLRSFSLLGFHLGGNQYLKDISPLGACPALHELVLHNCDELKDISPLRALTNLSHLDLSYCTRLPSLAGVGACALLSTLLLTGCTRLKDISGVGACRVLKCLHLDGCVKDALDCLKDISGVEACRVLKCLHLDGCVKVTDVSALALCTGLETISLASLRRLEDISPIGACHRVHTLDLSGSLFLGMDAVLAKLTALQSLDLGHCDANQRPHPRPPFGGRAGMPSTVGGDLFLKFEI